jgi:hypothetical protein
MAGNMATNKKKDMPAAIRLTRSLVNLSFKRQRMSFQPRVGISVGVSARRPRSAIASSLIHLAST